MGYPLKRLNPDPDRESPTFGVCDIESFDWIEFKVIGLAWETYPENSTKPKRNYEHFQDLGEFLDFAFSDEFPYENLFAHFGGRFDFSFILQEAYYNYEKYRVGEMIPRGSGFLCVEIHTFTVQDDRPSDENDMLGIRPDGKFMVKDRTIIFRDSSAMLPFGLASLTKNFKVSHKKKEIDYSTFHTVTDEMLEYLEYDNWGLHDVIKTYFNWDIIKKAGPAFTVAGQAIKVFRTYMKKDIACLSPGVDSFVRSSYFGGRTEIFKPFFEQQKDNGRMNSYDVNSLYPAVMRDLDFPGRFKFETSFFLENEMGFYDVEVFVPNMYVPPLGTRSIELAGRLIFPTGTFRGVWSTLELKYAMSVGCKINKVYKGMIFYNEGPIFREYIEDLYAKRKASEKNSVDDILCKLLMNSTYGRFGLNLVREKLVLDQGQLGLMPTIEIPTRGKNDPIIRLGTVPTFLDKSFANVAIPAWVTSGARIHMHKLIQQAPEDIFYMDTDSLKTTHRYPKNNVDLGHLKFEYNKKRAVYLLPKTYIEDTDSPMFSHFLEDGNEDKSMKSSKKIVMKGFDKRKISKFTFSDFSSCLEGEMGRMRSTNPRKFAPFKTAVRKGKFLAMLEENPRQIRSRYNKRKIYRSSRCKHVYDTEALHLKDGLIQNIDEKMLKKWKPPTSASLDKIMQEVITELQKGE